MNGAIYNLGRIFLAAIFLVSAYRKATGFDGYVERMSEMGIPFTEVMLIGAMGLEVIGGLMIATGYRARVGALLLIVFLIPVTLLFHPLTDPQQQTQFLKNLAVLGGLLVLASSRVRGRNGD